MKNTNPIIKRTHSAPIAHQDTKMQAHVLLVMWKKGLYAQHIQYAHERHSPYDRLTKA